MGPKLHNNKKCVSKGEWRDKQGWAGLRKECGEVCRGGGAVFLWAWWWLIMLPMVTLNVAILQNNQKRL